MVSSMTQPDSPQDRGIECGKRVDDRFGIFRIFVVEGFAGSGNPHAPAIRLTSWPSGYRHPFRGPRQCLPFALPCLTLLSDQLSSPTSSGSRTIHQIANSWRYVLVLTLPPQLEVALAEHARRHGIAPEALAIDLLRRHLLSVSVSPPAPADEWEARLFCAAIHCGVSVPDAALSSDGLGLAPAVALGLSSAESVGEVSRFVRGSVPSPEVL